MDGPAPNATVPLRSFLRRSLPHFYVFPPRSRTRLASSTPVALAKVHGERDIDLATVAASDVDQDGGKRHPDPGPDAASHHARKRPSHESTIGRQC
jgi:hypothetical protein